MFTVHPRQKYCFKNISKSEPKILCILHCQGCRLQREGTFLAYGKRQPLLFFSIALSKAELEVNFRITERKCNSWHFHLKYQLLHGIDFRILNKVHRILIVHYSVIEKAATFSYHQHTRIARRLFDNIVEECENANQHLLILITFLLETNLTTEAIFE